jgi:hypothetical protein
MAFPTIPTVAAGRVLFQLATNPAGTHTSPSLSSLTKNDGDLLVAIVILYDGNSTNAEFSSWGGSFTEFGDFAGTTTMAIGVAYKRSTGSETGTFTVTSADTSANDSCFILLSIPGAHRVTAPEAGSFSTALPGDPASFNPTGWDAEDTLWIAVGASGEVNTTGSYTGVASAPTNYTDYADSGISADAAGGVEGAVAFRQLNAASEDVGAFSVDTSNARAAALVIAIRPRNDQSVTPTTLSLTTSLLAPTIAHRLVVPVRTLATSTLAPAVSVGSVLTPTTASLAISTFAPTVTAGAGITVTPTTASLATSAFAPTVAATDNRTVVPTTAALSTSAFAPTVSAPRLATPTTVALTLSALAPTVEATQDVLVTPTTASLTASTLSAVVGGGVVPQTTALSLSALAPTIAAPRLATPTTASLVLSNLAPTVSAPRLVVPTTTALVTTALAPTVAAPRLVTPAMTALTLTTTAPSVTVGDDVEVVPDPRALVLATFAPYAIVPAVPGTASLVTTTFAPTVSASANVTVVPTTASLGTVTFAPTVDVSQGVEVVPGTAVLATATFAPTIQLSGSPVVTPDTAVLVLAAYVPVLSTLPTVVYELVQEALALHGGDPIQAGNWLLQVGATRMRYGPSLNMRDPLLGSIQRRFSAAEYALACMELGVTGIVLEDLKELGGVA